VASAPPALLDDLAERVRPHLLAGAEVLPLHPALGGLLGADGLKRGSTLLVGSPSGAALGATSLALALLAPAATEGCAVAVVDLPALGLAAAAEAGLPPERLVLVPDTQRRFLAVASGLLDACELVLVADPAGGVQPAAARRLAARVRERRAVLVVLSRADATLGRPPTRRPGSAAWHEVADARLELTSAHWIGLGPGHGHLTARLVEVLAHRRRRSPATARAWLWLPADDGRLQLAGEEALARLPGPAPAGVAEGRSELAATSSA